MSTATYNRIYSTMFDGSLYGKGALAIACWAYVLAEMKPDFGKSQFYVTLNARKMANAIGEPEEEVQAVIGGFCLPEKQSQSPEYNGCKLVKEGVYEYLVVNGAKYNEIRKREARREANRIAQQRFRKKQVPVPSVPMPGEKTGEQPHEWRTGPGGDLEGPPVETTSLPATSGRPNEVAREESTVGKMERAAHNSAPVQSADSAAALVVHRTLTEHQAARAASNAKSPSPSEISPVPRGVPGAPKPLRPPSPPVPSIATASPARQSPASPGAMPAAIRPVAKSAPPISQPVSPVQSAAQKPPSGVRSVAQVLPGALRRLPRPTANALSGGWQEEIVQRGQSGSPNPQRPSSQPEPSLLAEEPPVEE